MGSIGEDWPRGMVVGAMILLVYVGVALTGPLWMPFPFDKVSTGPPYVGPSRDHLFGTDGLGRDVLSRVVYGTRQVLVLSISSTLIATIAGGLVGPRVWACGWVAGPAVNAGFRGDG